MSESGQKASIPTCRQCSPRTLKWDSAFPADDVAVMLVHDSATNPGATCKLGSLPFPCGCRGCDLASLGALRAARTELAGRGPGGRLPSNAPLGLSTGPAYSNGTAEAGATRTPAPRRSFSTAAETPAALCSSSYVACVPGQNHLETSRCAMLPRLPRSIGTASRGSGASRRWIRLLTQQGP
jgi:hypothetical protein